METINSTTLHPIEVSPLLLWINVSNFGMQFYKNDVMIAGYPLDFFKIFTETKCRYSTYDRELQEVYSGLKHLQHFCHVYTNRKTSCVGFLLKIQQSFAKATTSTLDRP